MSNSKSSSPVAGNGERFNASAARKSQDYLARMAIEGRATMPIPRSVSTSLSSAPK